MVGLEMFTSPVCYRYTLIEQLPIVDIRTLIKQFSFCKELVVVLMYIAKIINVSRVKL